MKSPMDVRKLTTFMAIPFVSVGRMMEHTGSLRLKNGLGHDEVGLELFAAKRWRVQIGEGDRDVSHGICCSQGRSVAGLVEPGLKVHCFGGAILMRIRRTSTLVALCAMAG